MTQNTDNDVNVRLIEKINKVEEDYGKKFSNTQKILMTTDGSITAILDVLHGKIDLKTLEQHFEEATEESAKLVNVDKVVFMNKIAKYEENDKEMIKK